MAQLSRPFQIALLTLGVFVAVWFLALHHPGGGSSSSPSASGSAPAASGGSSVAKSSSVYHGSAPGVEGLTRAISRAHGAVSTSERNAQELQSKSAQASGEAASASAPSASASTQGATASTRGGASTTASTPTTASTAHTRTGSVHSQTGAAHPHTGTTGHGLQATVVRELAHGKIVLLLFWNPRSSDDAAVHRQVQAVAGKLGGEVAVHTASAKQVGSFGTITRDIQIYETPTLLIVNRDKQVTTLTGYTEAFAIKQAIAQARK